MARKVIQGICHLCGIDGPLSFEHVPPRAAFNNRPVVATSIDELLGKGKFDPKLGKVHQRGAGAYTLCESCNNLTGTWYGSKYVEWVYQGMQIPQYARGTPTLLYPFHYFPLRVIKQVACMFFSVNTEHFRQAQPELEYFVRNKEKRFLPDDINFHMFYAVGNSGRHSGVMGKIDTSGGSRSSTYAEVTFPPFGYLMSFGKPPREDLLDITYFSRFEYNTFRSDHLKIPVLPVISYVPGDFRTQDEIDDAIRKNTEGTAELR